MWGTPKINLKIAGRCPVTDRTIWIDTKTNTKYFLEEYVDLNQPTNEQLKKKLREISENLHIKGRTYDLSNRCAEIELSPKSIKIKVMRSDKLTYWYANKIGETFEVEDYNSHEYKLLQGNNVGSAYFDKNDVEVIKETTN